jgi:hypothetical protein
MITMPDMVRRMSNCRSGGRFVVMLCRSTHYHEQHHDPGDDKRAVGFLRVHTLGTRGTDRADRIPVAAGAREGTTIVVSIAPASVADINLPPVATTGRNRRAAFEALNHCR